MTRVRINLKCVLDFRLIQRSERTLLTFMIFSGLAPTRARLLISSGARRISRRSRVLLDDEARAGSSLSRPSRISAGTRRLERCEPSS